LTIRSITTHLDYRWLPNGDDMVSVWSSVKNRFFSPT
jgi:hypothetical protein